MVNCVTSVQYFWKQVVGRYLQGDNSRYLQGDSSRTSILNLPEDVIINILSRLPAQSVLDCKLVLSQWNQLSSTPYFAELHVTNVTPLLLVEDRQYTYYDAYKSKPTFILMNGCGKNARFRKVCMKTMDIPYAYRIIQLLCSCDGILIFKFRTRCVYMIHNPITRDNFVFRDKKHKILGFFSHEADKDYKLLLYEKDDRKELCDYYLYGLRNKDKRLLGSSHCWPLPYIGVFDDDEGAIVVSAAAFWMTKCTNKSEFSKECPQSIMMLDLMTEKFYIRPHPGPTCASCSFISNFRLHEQMRLLELGGMLSLCNVRESTIEVWILEDVKTWFWIKNFVVKLDRPYDHEKWRWAHPVVAIHGGNLLLNWRSRGIFWCNLASNYMWKIKAPYEFDLAEGSFYAVKYTSSFVSFEVAR